MTASISNNNLNSDRHLTISEAREQLIKTAISAIRTISRDNAIRLQIFDKNIQSLNSGIFYGSAYYKALVKTDQQALLDFHKIKGSFYYGYAPTKHFYMPLNPTFPTGVQPYRFVIYEDVKPSDALEAMRKGPSFLGCGEVCQIAYLEAIKELLGKEKFDCIFAAESSTPLTIQLELNNPFNCLTTNVRPEEIKTGQIVFFQNIPEYKIKHPHDDAQGFWSICCDDTPGKETFTSLGLSADGLKREEVQEALYTEYNNLPMGLETVTKEIADRILKTLNPLQLNMIKQYAAHQVSREEFSIRGGGKITFSVDFNFERIMELANTSTEKARALFTKWVKSR